MKASTKQAPVGIMSGLTAEAEAALSHALTDLQVYDDRLHLMGALEREQMQACERKLQARLAPTPIDSLVAEARQLITKFGPTLDRSREAAHQREAELAEESAKRLAAKEARRQLLVAKIKAEEAKRQAMLAQIQGGT